MAAMAPSGWPADPRFGWDSGRRSGSPRATDLPAAIGSATATRPAASSGSAMTAREQPRDAPRLQFVARHGAANVGVGGEDQAAGHRSDERSARVREIREETQRRAVGESPVDGERAVVVEANARRRAGLRNARDDLAAAEREQAPIMAERARVARLGERIPIEHGGTRGRRVGRVRQLIERAAEALEAGELAPAAFAHLRGKVGAEVAEVGKRL